MCCLLGSMVVLNNQQMMPLCYTLQQLIKGSRFYPQFKTKIQCGDWHQLYCCCEINSLNVRGQYWLDHFQLCFGQQWKLILKMVSNFQPDDRPFSPSIRQCLKLTHCTIGVSKTPM